MLAPASGDYVLIDVKGASELDDPGEGGEAEPGSWGGDVSPRLTVLGRGHR